MTSRGSEVKTVKLLVFKQDANSGLMGEGLVSVTLKSTLTSNPDGAFSLWKVHRTTSSVPVENRPPFATFLSDRLSPILSCDINQE